MKTNREDGGKMVFQSLLKDNPDAALVIDHQGNIEEANIVARKQYNIPVNITNLTIADLLVWPEMGTVLNRNAHNNTSPSHGIYYARKKDDTLIELNISVFEYKGDDRILCMIREITEFMSARRMGSDTIMQRHFGKDSHQFSIMQSLMNSTDAIIFSVDKEYNYTWFNDRHASIMSMIYGKEPQIGISILDLLTNKSDRDKAKSNIDRSLAGEQLVEESYSGEEKLSRRFFRVSHNPIAVDSGEISGVVVIAQDLSEQKKEEERIVAKEHEFRNLAESSPGLMGSYYLKPDGKICMPYTSPQIEHLFDLTSDEVAIDATPLMKRTHPEDIKRVIDSISESARTMKQWHLEYRILHPTRGEIWLEGTTNPKPHADGGVIWYGFVHDITQRKLGEIALARLNRELGALLSCRRIILRVEDENSLIRDICQMICDEAGYRMAWVGYGLGDETGLIRPMAWAGGGSDFGEMQHKFVESRGRDESEPAEMAVSDNRIIYVKDIGNVENMKSWRNFSLQQGFRSCIALPIRESKNRAFGALLVYSSEINAFLPEEQRLLESLSDDLSYGILTLRIKDQKRIAEENLQKAYGEMEQRVELRTAELRKANDQLAALYKVSQAISLPMKLDDVLTVIAQSTATLLNSDTGAILLLNESGDALTIRGASGLSKQVIEGTMDMLGESIAGRVVLTGQPIIANDLQNESRFFNPSAADEGLLACASVPLRVGGRIIGTLDIHSKTNRFAFGEEHVNFLNLLASQAAIAIENARLYEQIQQARDDLEIRVQERTSELLSMNAQLEKGIAEQNQIKEELQRSNALLRAIFEAAPIAIFDLDRNGLVKTVWNPAAERIFGWKRQEVIGNPLPTVPDEKRQEFQELERWIHSGKTLADKEVQRRRRDGTLVDCSLYASPLYNSEGLIIGNVTVVADITERKRAEREIANMNRILRILSDTDKALIHFKDETALLHEVCSILVNIGGYKMARVGYPEYDAEKSIRQVAYAGFDSGYFTAEKVTWGDDERGRGPGGEAVRTGKICIIHNIPEAANFRPWKEAAVKSGFKSIIALPLIMENSVFGVIGIYSGDTDSFNNEEVAILQELGEDLSFGISALRAQTIKRKAEEALRASEKRFSAVFRFSPLAICIINAQSDCITDVNDTFLAVSGYERKELIGRTTKELGLFSSEADRDHVLQILKEQGIVKSIEFNARTKTGEIRTALSAMTAVEINGTWHYLALIHDITERKQSEEKLHLLGAALENTANSIVITDKSAGIIWANAAFCKLTGYTIDETIGRKPQDLVFSGIHSRDFYADMWKTILGGMDWHGEIVNKRKDGSIYHEFMTITPVRDDNQQIQHFIAVKQDVTKQKKAEEELRMAKEKAEESNRLKSAFLATMNHELRTPLNHIIGFSDLMRSGAVLENITDFAEIIYNSSQNLLEIIEGIFELAIAEQSDIKLRLQTLKCLDLFLENKSVLQEIIEISGKRDQIDLLFNADKELLLRNITTDKVKINQVLINLFKNAVKFTKSGKIEFGLISEREGWLTFYVEDTGIGVPEDKHEIIFEFFRQADDTHTRQYGGVGIGLAISMKIAEVMHGCNR